METGQIYGLILALGMIGIIIGITLTVLGKLGTSVLGTANKSTYKPYLAINATVNSLYDIPNSWLSVIVIVAVAGVILAMVMKFSGGTR